MTKRVPTVAARAAQASTMQNSSHAPTSTPSNITTASPMLTATTISLTYHAVIVVAAILATIFINEPPFTEKGRLAWLGLMLCICIIAKLTPHVDTLSDLGRLKRMIKEKVVGGLQYTFGKRSKRVAHVFIAGFFILTVVTWINSVVLRGSNAVKSSMAGEISPPLPTPTDLLQLPAHQEETDSEASLVMYAAPEPTRVASTVDDEALSQRWRGFPLEQVKMALQSAELQHRLKDLHNEAKRGWCGTSIMNAWREEMRAQIERDTARVRRERVTAERAERCKQASKIERWFMSC